MNKTKKLSFYELDPRYFKDYSRDGIGDFSGLSSKMDYFKYLGVDAVILRNVLSVNSNDKVQNFTKIAEDLGDVNDLGKAISIAKNKGTKIFLELGIGNIKESHRWFKNATERKNEQFAEVVEFKSLDGEDTTGYKYNSATKTHYVIDEATQLIPLNWKSEQVIEQFVKVIKFWSELGVNGFVFKNFEYVADSTKTEIMSGATLKELRKFYRAIKEINDEIIVVGKSKIVPIEDTAAYTGGATQVFDYFLSEAISFIGSKNMDADVIGKFKPKELASQVEKYVKNPSNIVSFGSARIGRIASRWGDSGQFAQESAKALSMLMMLTPGSSSIYYGDELGSLNIGLTHLDDFQDDTLSERKRNAQAKGVKERKFMQAQVLQNKINARSLMAWNSEKNGGFSNSERTITPVSSSYKEINVANQFAEEASTLNFVKKINNFIHTSVYADVVEKGSFKISTTFSGVIKVESRYMDKEIKIFINLSDKTKSIAKIKGGKILLSSYGYKKYSNTLPVKLEAYESFLIGKKTNEAIKASAELLLVKDKAEARRADLLEREKVLKEETARRREHLVERQEKLSVQESALAKEESKRQNAEENKLAKLDALAKKKEVITKKEEKRRAALADELGKAKAKKLLAAEKLANLEEIEAEKQRVIDEGIAAEKEAKAEKARIDAEAEKARLEIERQAQEEETKILNMQEEVYKAETIAAEQEAKVEAKLAEVVEKEQLRTEKIEAKQAIKDERATEFASQKLQDEVEAEKVRVQYEMEAKSIAKQKLEDEQREINSAEELEQLREEERINNEHARQEAIEAAAEKAELDAAISLEAEAAEEEWLEEVAEEEVIKPYDPMWAVKEEEGRIAAEEAKVEARIAALQRKSDRTNSDEADLDRRNVEAEETIGQINENILGYSQELEAAQNEIDDRSSFEEEMKTQQLELEELRQQNKEAEERLKGFGEELNFTEETPAPFFGTNDADVVPETEDAEISVADGPAGFEGNAEETTTGTVDYFGKADETPEVEETPVFEEATPEVEETSFFGEEKVEENPFETTTEEVKEDASFSTETSSFESNSFEAPEAESTDSTHEEHATEAPEETSFFGEEAQNTTDSVSYFDTNEEVVEESNSFEAPVLEETTEEVVEEENPFASETSTFESNSFDTPEVEEVVEENPFSSETSSFESNAFEAPVLEETTEEVVEENPFSSETSSFESNSFDTPEVEETTEEVVEEENPFSSETSTFESNQTTEDTSFLGNESSADDSEFTFSSENTSLEETNENPIHNFAPETPESSELDHEKERARAERNVAKEINRDTSRFGLMEEEVLEEDRTTLTEADIAPTTQIDVDELDDFDLFLKDDEN